MEIANVMDDHTQREWPAIGITGEVLGHLGVVVGRLVSRAVITNPVGQVLKSSDDIISRLFEGEVGKAATLIKVRLVDEVPSALETVGALNVISESSTLSEGVAGLTLGQRGMGVSQTLELSKGVGEGSGVFLFKDRLGLPCD